MKPISTKDVKRMTPEQRLALLKCYYETHPFLMRPVALAIKRIYG